MRKTRGQASLEFLMTYGWAILVIGVVLVVLWQWGLFTPSGGTKTTYMGFWGVMPVDFSYRSNGKLNISLQNNIIDGSINITGINITAQGIPSNYPISPAQALSAGQIFNWEATVSAGENQGNAYSVLMTIEYVDNRTGPGIPFKSSGTLQGSIEG
jgi:hypothetical protein